MLSQKLNLIQRDNLQELVCTITSCEFKFLIQRIFSTFLEKSQIVSAVFKWQRIQSSGSGKKSNTVKRTTAENVTRVTGGRAGASYRLVLRNVARCLGWWRVRAANEPSAKFSQLLKCANRRFQPREGPSGGLLRDCENFIRWFVRSSSGDTRVQPVRGVHPPPTQCTH